jgi:phosphoribosylaminoimidazole-succinocarboxamide synthase
MPNDPIITQTCRHGKVRDIYDLGGNELVIITTDRISAFDQVLKPEIPNRGRILQALSLFWADLLDVGYHLISDEDHHMPDFVRGNPYLAGRAMLVEKAEVIPFECVVRGFLCGSAWKDYQKTGEVCGIKLPAGLKENMPLPQPIFTPATKAQTGHDENISYEVLEKAVGEERAAWLESKSIELYEDGRKHCWEKGLILADTKFEWGILKHMEDEVVLIDEVLTSDSSRLWPIDQYQLGTSIASYDKQFVRDWLEQSGWDKNSTPPVLPDEVVQKIKQKYIDAYELITSKKWLDKEGWL